MNESENIEMHSCNNLVRTTSNAITKTSSPTHQISSAPNTRINYRYQEANEPEQYYNQFDEADLRSLQSRGASPGSPRAGVGRLTYLELLGDCRQGRPESVMPESNHYDRLPSMVGQSGHRATERSPYERNQYEGLRTSTTNYHGKPTGRKRNILIASVILVVPCVFLVAVLTGINLIGQQIENRIEDKLLDFQANMSNIFSRRRDFNNLKFASDTPSVSPELRVKYKNTCYCVYTRKVSWFDARDFCMGLGPDVYLAEIKSASLNTYLVQHLAAFFRTPHSVWLGASDIVISGVLMWNFTRTSIQKFNPTRWKRGLTVTESESTTNCLRNEGTNLKTFQWNTADCALMYTYMCQSPEVGEKCSC